MLASGLHKQLTVTSSPTASPDPNYIVVSLPLSHTYQDPQVWLDMRLRSVAAKAAAASVSLRVTQTAPGSEASEADSMDDDYGETHGQL